MEYLGGIILFSSPVLLLLYIFVPILIEIAIETKIIKRIVFLIFLMVLLSLFIGLFMNHGVLLVTILLAISLIVIGWIWYPNEGGNGAFMPPFTMVSGYVIIGFLLIGYVIDSIIVSGFIIIGFILIGYIIDSTSPDCSKKK